jgi:hypothetical protein
VPAPRIAQMAHCLNACFIFESIGPRDRAAA